MDTFDKISELLKDHHMTQADLSRATGISTGLISQWKKRMQSPSAEKLRLIAIYFNVPLENLLPELETCEKCEFVYSPKYAPDSQAHLKRHRKWEAAKKKFGIWNKAEQEKRIEYREIEKSSSNPLEKRIEAAKKVMFAYFSRSVEGSEFNLSHISFEEYIPYFLSSQKQAFQPDTYKKLVEEYGVKCGMHGTYWMCKSSPEKSQLQDSNVIDISGMIPIVGKIPAGYPVLAQENIEGYMPTMMKNPNEYFYLRVSGVSMINAGIPNGSLVLIHKQPCAENGEIVACRVNGNEATLKRFKPVDKNTVVLMPENPDFQPIIVSTNDFNSGYAEIIGVAKQVITNI